MLGLDAFVYAIVVLTLLVASFTASSIVMAITRRKK